MLRPFAPPVVLLLRVFGSCCEKFETNISFFSVIAERCATMLDLFCTAFYNTAGATHVHYTWSPKSNGLYPSYDVLQVPTLLGVVASVCTPL